MSYIPIGTDARREYWQTVMYHAGKGPTLMPFALYFEFQHEIIASKISVEIVTIPAYGKFVKIEQETK